MLGLNIPAKKNTVCENLADMFNMTVLLFEKKNILAALH